MDNLSPPSVSGYTVYTKENCKYCTHVKALLEPFHPVWVPCDRFLLEDKAAFLERVKEWTKQEWKTFPMVFHNGTFLGGFTETQKHLEKETLVFDDDEV